MNTTNRVAVNTLIQYIQLFFQLLLGFVTVRLVLDALGPSDYGIYDVIGGIIAMMGLISSSLSQTSMRFISVSLGKNDNKQTREIFKSCFFVHFIVAIIFFILLEAIGLFLFKGNLNVPLERVETAYVVYHCMIFSLFLNILSTPFVALITSHEYFVYISIVGIITAVLKLIIAFIISNTYMDKLCLYGILMASITLVDTFLYVLFCIYRYKEQISIGKASFKETRKVFSFAGWTILDVFGLSAPRQGYSILITQYFGPVVNASYSLARQMGGYIDTIGGSLINTMKPQIMISEGHGNSKRMFRLSLTAGKFSVSLISLIIVPFIVMMPEVLDLWLKEVPEYAVLFTRLMLGVALVDQITKGLVFANQAVGNIKWFSIIVSSIRMMSLPVSWFFYARGYPALYAIVIFLVFETLASLSRVVVLSKISEFQISLFVKSVFIKVIPLLCSSFIICYTLYQFFTGVWGMIFIVSVNLLFFTTIMYFIGLTKEEKQSMVFLIKSFIKRLESK